jgi:hypothetical protein
MTNRLPVVVAFFTGACFVAIAVVAFGRGEPRQPTLAEKKAMLKQAGFNKVVGEQLAEIKFGAQQFSDEETADGNQGVVWNYGENFAVKNTNAMARGWKSGADTVDRYNTGVGMFGKWAYSSSFAPSAFAAPAPPPSAGPESDAEAPAPPPPPPADPPAPAPAAPCEASGDCCDYSNDDYCDEPRYGSAAAWCADGTDHTDCAIDKDPTYTDEAVPSLQSNVRRRRI